MKSDLMACAQEWAAAKAAADAHRKTPKPANAHYWTCEPGPNILSDHWVRYENCAVCEACADENAAWASAQRRLSTAVRRAERRLLRAIAEAAP